jgi:hypothetical protein
VGERVLLKSVGKWSNAKAEHGTFSVAEMQDVGEAACTWSNTWVWGFE